MRANPDRLRQKAAVCAPLSPRTAWGVAGAPPLQKGYGQTAAGRQGKAFPSDLKSHHNGITDAERINAAPILTHNVHFCTIGA